MGRPFCIDGFEDEQERLDAVAGQVIDYLAALAADPDAAGGPPEILVWLLRIEQWGLHNPGGFIQQPYHFMLELEAAQAGREHYRQKQEKTRQANAKLQAEYDAGVAQQMQDRPGSKERDRSLQELLWPGSE